jgi:transposase
VEVIDTLARLLDASRSRKARFVEETVHPGNSISPTTRRYTLSPSLLFRWRRLTENKGH